MNKPLSRSKKIAAMTIFASLKSLKENGGSMPGRELMQKLDKSLDLDDWAITEITGIWMHGVI